MYVDDVNLFVEVLSEVNNLKIPVVFLIYPLILSFSENISLYLPYISNL